MRRLRLVAAASSQQHQHTAVGEQPAAVAAISYRLAFPAASDSAIIAIARRSIASSNEASRSSSCRRRRTKRRIARSSSNVTASSTRRSRSRKTDAPMRPGGVRVKRRMPQPTSRSTRTVLVNCMTVLSSHVRDRLRFERRRYRVRSSSRKRSAIAVLMDGTRKELPPHPPEPATGLPPGRATNGLGTAGAVAWGFLPCPRSPATSRS